MSELSVDFEKRVYQAYRLTLKQLKKAANGSSCRAADRRNRARQVVVTRYNVSFQEVKRIVAKFDALNNITHEPDRRYGIVLNLQKAREEFQANPVPCSCGSQYNVNVHYNPFDVEIYGEYVLVVSCDTCYTRLEEDI